jgi:hypothetical protein
MIGKARGQSRQLAENCNAQVAEITKKYRAEVMQRKLLYVDKLFALNAFFPALSCKFLFMYSLISFSSRSLQLQQDPGVARQHPCLPAPAPRQGLVRAGAQPDRSHAALAQGKREPNARTKERGIKREECHDL